MITQSINLHNIAGSSSNAILIFGIADGNELQVRATEVGDVRII